MRRSAVYALMVVMSFSEQLAKAGFTYTQGTLNIHLEQVKNEKECVDWVRDKNATSGDGMLISQSVVSIEDIMTKIGASNGDIKIDIPIKSLLDTHKNYLLMYYYLSEVAKGNPGLATIYSVAEQLNREDRYNYGITMDHVRDVDKYCRAMKLLEFMRKNDAGVEAREFVGIGNSGNKCHMDALLQLLYHIPQLRDAIGTAAARLSEGAANKEDEAEDSFDLCDEELEGEELEEEIYTPGCDVVTELGRYFKEMEEGESPMVVNNWLSKVYEGSSEADHPMAGQDSHEDFSKLEGILAGCAGMRAHGGSPFTHVLFGFLTRKIITHIATGTAKEINTTGGTLIKLKNPRPRYMFNTHMQLETGEKSDSLTGKIEQWINKPAGANDDEMQDGMAKHYITPPPILAVYHSRQTYQKVTYGGVYTSKIGCVVQVPLEMDLADQSFEYVNGAQDKIIEEIKKHIDDVKGLVDKFSKELDRYCNEQKIERGNGASFYEEKYNGIYNKYKKDLQEIKSILDDKKRIPDLQKLSLKVEKFYKGVNKEGNWTDGDLCKICGKYNDHTQKSESYPRQKKISDALSDVMLSDELKLRLMMLQKLRSALYLPTKYVLHGATVHGGYHYWAYVRDWKSYIKDSTDKFVYISDSFVNKGKSIEKVQKDLDDNATFVMYVREDYIPYMGETRKPLPTKPPVKE
ncbi:MAG: hypothetical protein LBF56_00315 [Holosporales bacterium]|nr:hypothetical protein [Holosporales bacterium]